MLPADAQKEADERRLFAQRETAPENSDLQMRSRENCTMFALDGLAAAGLLTEQERRQLSELMTVSGEPFDLAICGLALVEEEALADALSTIFGYRRFLEFDDASLARRLSRPFLASKRCIPILEHPDRVVVAIADPTDMTGLRGCAFAFCKMAEPVIATGSQIEVLLQNANLATETSPGDDGFLEENHDAERLKDLASAEPAVRLCNRLISEAVKARASDIHLEPTERRFRIRVRIDGALVDRETLSIRQGLAVVSRFKILSNLDIAERRRPQDGRFTFAVGGKAVDLRISVTPNVHGEAMVLRLLRREDLPDDLEALGFSPEAGVRLRGLADKPNGILLLTGPTGSGKTTTLYALLHRLAKRDLKILTIEDPVEYALAGVSQTQVNPQIGLTFASALRAFLRQDPDIIMVGEMRDVETARVAVQAALTGHLVLSTLHTNDAPSAVVRLLDMGVEDYLIASTLIGVVAQRLVRKICSECGGPDIPRAVDAAPCGHCEGSGYRGRIAVAEVMAVDDRLRAAIRMKPTEAALAETARYSGFADLRQDGELKVKAGLTTRRELNKAVGE